MSSNKFPVSRSKNLVVHDLKGEILIYDLEINKAFALNETSALVWQECDGTKDISQIARVISEKLRTPVSDDFVWLALDSLSKENLIENGNRLSFNFSGMSRRDVIKKVGLGTMVALPLISAITAPSAAQAASSPLIACTVTCPTGIDTCPQGFCCAAIDESQCTAVGDPSGAVICPGRCFQEDIGACGFTC